MLLPPLQAISLINFNWGEPTQIFPIFSNTDFEHFRSDRKKSEKLEKNSLLGLLLLLLNFKIT